jgi:histidinol-phosphate/aromatic aminotransferase/cobyric acid decarboxylase-like protein
MSTSTQFNPNRNLNAELLAAGASKTVYALVTTELEAVKRFALGYNYNPEEFFKQFRNAWTGKQDYYHEAFFETWVDWAVPLIEFDRNDYPFYYPTAGASEPIRQLIFDLAVKNSKATIHFFDGEYEGYKAMAEAAGLKFMEHNRMQYTKVSEKMHRNDLFFISQPSAIDGMVWNKFNDFVVNMPINTVVADITYVGAVPKQDTRIYLMAPSIKNVVFSLSKPFGCYYDRIGGVWCKEENLAMFANKWFKNLTSIQLGTAVMEKYGVFDFPDKFAPLQREAVEHVSEKLGINFRAADVFILGKAQPTEDERESDLGQYLRRGANDLRVCLTPYMAKELGMTV